jgi:hypothetical protein
VNAARLTKERGSLFWPSVVASEVRQGFQDRSRGMKGSQESLTTAVVKDAANWSTPNCTDGKTGSTTTQGRSLVADIQLHGQAAPASSSSLGSRQGLWQATKHKRGDLWSTPRTGATESSRPNNKGGIPLADQAKREQWAAPQAKDHKSGHRDPTIVQYKQLNVEVEARATGKLNQAWVCCLMGVPVGWVDPMCPASVIKNWPRFVSGWLQAQTAQIPCDSSAMEFACPPQSEPSEFFLAS